MRAAGDLRRSTGRRSPSPTRAANPDLGEGRVEFGPHAGPSRTSAGRCGASRGRSWQGATTTQAGRDGCREMCGAAGELAMSPRGSGSHIHMTSITCQMSISLDGYAAGPNQSLDNPLGEGGMRLHEWAIATPRGTSSTAGAASATSTRRSSTRLMKRIGAYIMGRKMFGGGDGPWDESWRGWWGEDPPYHAPVYVLTHHEREPLEMQGGTTFDFVTDGIESALEQARAAAGERASRSPAARAPCSSTWRPGCSTSSTCTSRRSSSAPASGCSRTSATRARAGRGHRLAGRDARALSRGAVADGLEADIERLVRRAGLQQLAQTRGEGRRDERVGRAGELVEGPPALLGEVDGSDSPRLPRSGSKAAVRARNQRSRWS